MSFMPVFFAARFASNPPLTARLPEFLNLMKQIFSLLADLLVPAETIIGGVFGIIFVAFRKRIPGKSTVRKALVFAFSLWSIQFITSILGYLAQPPAYANLMKGMLFSLTIQGYLLTALEDVVLGCLFGYLLTRRLKPK
jgi:hypothetical protein